MLLPDVAARDYRRSRGTLVFNFGDTSKCAPVTIRDDTDDESNENFFIDWTNLDFSNADDREYQLTRARTTVTIRDNDASPTRTPRTPRTTRTPRTNGHTRTTRPPPPPPPRRPSFCWLCRSSQWTRTNGLCHSFIRDICGYTFPITNAG